MKRIFKEQKISVNLINNENQDNLKKISKVTLKLLLIQAKAFKK